MAPKWATPERQAQLTGLWGQYANRCLLGHLTCRVEEHYLHTRGSSEVVGVPAAVKVEGRDGVVRTWNTHLPHTVLVEKTDWVGGLYFLREEAVIAEWQADDRAERVALLRKEQRQLHQDNRRLIGGRWDTTARERHHAEHPLYYLAVVGVSALTKKRVARVRIACSPVRLWVELPSKNAIRQAKRYGAQGPKSINEAIVQAVHEYRASQ